MCQSFEKIFIPHPISARSVRHTQEHNKWNSNFSISAGQSRHDWRCQPVRFNVEFKLFVRIYNVDFGVHRLQNQMKSIESVCERQNAMRKEAKEGPKMNDVEAQHVSRSTTNWNDGAVFSQESCHVCGRRCDCCIRMHSKNFQWLMRGMARTGASARSSGKERETENQNNWLKR